MKMTVKTQVNAIQEITMEAEGNSEECMRQLGAIIAFNGKCGCCQSGNVNLGFKEVGKQDKYTFTEFICNDCNARAQWGKYKSGGFFLKNWEKYDPNAQSGHQGGQSQGGYSDNQVPNQNGPQQDHGIPNY